MCIAVLGLASGVLALDRALVVSGDGADGAGPAGARAAAGAVSQQDLPALPPGEFARKQTLSERFAALSETHGLKPGDVSDAFTPSRAWVEECSSARDCDGNLTAAEVFAKRYELKAVVLGGAGSAIVDDCCLVVGQELDGFKLISIGERSVIFESDGHRVTLELKDGT